MIRQEVHVGPEIRHGLAQQRRHAAQAGHESGAGLVVEVEAQGCRLTGELRFQLGDPGPQLGIVGQLVPGKAVEAAVADETG